MIRSRVAGLPGKRVLCVVDTDPLYVAGPGSHLDELIEVAGGENIFADAEAAYQVVSLETALERLPEVIINLSIGGLEGGNGRGPGYWGRWEFLPAVQSNEVSWLHPQLLGVPGPRMPEMAEMLVRLIHPAEFGRLEPEEMGPMTEGEPGGS
jgi:iron complex transport system substrate-binding protein